MILCKICAHPISPLYSNFCEGHEHVHIWTLLGGVGGVSASWCDICGAIQLITVGGKVSLLVPRTTENLDNLEMLSDLQHTFWSIAVAHAIPEVSEERRIRWEKLRKTEYDELSEDEKAKDRKYAKVLQNVIMNGRGKENKYD